VILRGLVESLPMNEYYLLNGQDQVGPYTGDQIADMRSKGILGDLDYFWREGMAEWQTLLEAFSPGGEFAPLAAPIPKRIPSKPPTLPLTSHALVVIENQPWEIPPDQDPRGLGYSPSPRPGATSSPLAASDAAQSGDLLRCPHCGSPQFFGRRKVSRLGWTLYICALVNVVISGLLMTIGIGFCTIILSPILAIIGFHGCQAHVNTCAKCKRDF